MSDGPGEDENELEFYKREAAMARAGVNEAVAHALRTSGVAELEASVDRLKATLAAERARAVAAERSLEAHKDAIRHAARALKALTR